MREIKVKQGTSVMCLDNSGKPESIKTKDWLEEGKIYTVVKVIRAIIQNKLGYVLEEIATNDPAFFGYDTKRFALPFSVLEEMMKRGEIEVEDRILEKV
jgi:hypothetical protein